MPIPRLLRVFLCHAKEGKPIVRELYCQLTAEGWLDERKLLPDSRDDLRRCPANHDEN